MLAENTHTLTLHMSSYGDIVSIINPKVTEYNVMFDEPVRSCKGTSEMRYLGNKSVQNKSLSQ